MPKLSLTQWFALWMLAMLILIVVTQPTSRPDRLDDIEFQTTEGAEIYFRNVRAYHYLQKEEASGILDVYRLKALYSDSAYAVLPFAIYNNWRANEAFVRLDTAYLDKQWSAVLRDSLSYSHIISLPEMDNESQYLFAVEVYRSIRDEFPLAMISANGDTLRLEGEARKLAGRVLADYFKLVGRL
jgi:hypothetical protein